jgi:hypothetical protein
VEAVKEPFGPRLFEDLGTHDRSFQSTEGEKVLSCPLHICLGVFGP